jgi:serine/threonine-protein kinase
VRGQTRVIKLLDLGLARLQELPLISGPALTQLGVIVGTVDFLAPEQARDSSAVDIRADLYSLGCTFCYLLTGRPPFPGGMATEKLLRHGIDPPPPLTLCPPAVRAVVHKLMAKRPADRYQTPAELADALAELLAAPARLSAGRSSAQVPTVPFVSVPPPRSQPVKKAGRSTGKRPRVVVTRDRPSGKRATATRPAVRPVVVVTERAPGVTPLQRLSQPKRTPFTPPPLPRRNRHFFWAAALTCLLLAGSALYATFALRGRAPAAQAEPPRPVPATENQRGGVR